MADQTQGRETDKRHGERSARVLGTLATVLNMTVAVIVTFEAIVRLCSFLKTWKPTNTRRMGFRKDPR